MTDYCRRFLFVSDMNGDMAFTVTDIWLLFKQVWLFPSNFLVETLYRFESMASFFEIDCGTGQGLGGAIFSTFFWFYGLVFFSYVIANSSRTG